MDFARKAGSAFRCPEVRQVVDKWRSCLSDLDTDRLELVQEFKPLIGCGQMDEPNKRTASSMAGITSNAGK